MPQYCLQTKNYEGKTVVFEENVRLLKAKKHSELRVPSFINGRVQKTIKAPEFVYDVFGYEGLRAAYYMEEFIVNGISRYTKVVVEQIGNPLKVITAFRPNNVKESGKTKLLYSR